MLKVGGENVDPMEIEFSATSASYAIAARAVPTLE